MIVYRCTKLEKHYTCHLARSWRICVYYGLPRLCASHSFWIWLLFVGQPFFSQSPFDRPTSITAFFFKLSSTLTSTRCSSILPSSFTPAIVRGKLLSHAPCLVSVSVASALDYTCMPHTSRAPFVWVWVSPTIPSMSCTSHVGPLEIIVFIV